MRKVKHTKIRNSGLLFEFLLRQITSDVLNKIDGSKAVNIIKKRFNETTELGKELALYNIIINKKFNNDRKADYFINEVINERCKLNNTLLKREKYNLIKEITEHYDLQKFISSKVENYKIYASTFKLFEYSNSLSPDEKTESHFNLIEHITSKSEVKLSETINNLPNDPDLRILTYRVLLERFNEKYSKLNKDQRDLLKAYINNISNTNSLKEYIDDKVPNLKAKLISYVKYIDDKVTKIKLNEAIFSMDKFCKTNLKSKMVKDSTIIQIMRYMELLKELQKSAKK